jgi:hypothetical protein
MVIFSQIWNLNGIEIVIRSLRLETVRLGIVRSIRYNSREINAKAKLEARAFASLAEIKSIE